MTPCCTRGAVARGSRVRLISPRRAMGLFTTPNAGLGTRHRARWHLRGGPWGRRVFSGPNEQGGREPKAPSHPVDRPNPSLSSGAFRRTTLRACLLERRVNLLVAPEEVATVVDIRRRRRDGLGRRTAARHPLAQPQPVAGIRVHEPDPHPIAIWRPTPIPAP